MPSGSDVRAGGAFVELYTKNRSLIGGLRRAGKAIKAFGAKMQAIGIRIALMGGLMLAPFVAAIRIFEKVGDRLDKMAARTGVTVSRLSELQFAVEQGGADVETLEKGLAAMSRALNDLSDGLMTQITAFEKLGLATEDFLGLSPDQAFLLITKRLSEIEDPITRSALAMKIFGRAGRALLPMIDDINALTEEAKALGLTIDKDTAASAARLTDAMNKAKRVLVRIMVEIGAAFGDSLSDIFERFANVSKALIDFMRRNRKMITLVASVAAAVTVFGVALAGLGFMLIGIGASLSFVASILGLIKGAFLLLFSPIGMSVALVVAATVAFVRLTESGAVMAAGIRGAMASAWESVKQFFAQLGDAIGLGVELIMAGEIGAAFRVMWAGIKVTWIKAIHVLKTEWAAWKTAIIKTASDTQFGLQRGFVKGGSMLERAWSKTVGFLTDIWSIFAHSIMSVWDNVSTWIAKKWLQLQELITGESTAAQQKVVDEDAARRQKIRDKERGKQIQASSMRERGAMSDIDAAEQRDLDSLDKRQSGVDAALDKQYQDSVGAAQAELDAAQKDFSAAMGTGRKALATAKKNAKKKVGETGGDTLADAVGSAPSLGGAAGAFSKFAAGRSLAVGGPVEKMADDMSALLGVQKDALATQKKTNQQLGFA